MDFSTLLYVAKKNNESTKSEGKYYNTKFSPPKKLSKEKKLSENIQKFLQKRELEEKQKQIEHNRKVANLLAMRDEKSKNKIRKMLKVTKSANKSVLDDAKSDDHTAITLAGPDQPDQDDYGYVSNEANAFYQKYIEKVKDVKEDKCFAPSRPLSLNDLSGTKERVKAAITKESEEKKYSSRNRPSGTTTSLNSTANVGKSHSSNSKTLYDPEAEKRVEERRKREELAKKMKNRKPAPPPMDFQSLLKLAEKKQHEPIEIKPPVKKKEPTRLLTSKEKKELEEQKRFQESRKQRNGKEPQLHVSDINERSIIKPVQPQKSTSSGLNSRVDSNNSSSKKASTNSQNSSPIKIPKNDSAKSMHSTANSFSDASKTKSSSNGTSVGASLSKSLPKSQPTLSNKNVVNSMRNQLTARDTKLVKPVCDNQKTRIFPPTDVRKGPSNITQKNKRLQKPIKRRIIDDDDEEEYDSELDDFIDDGDCEEDYSSHIRAIFGYDKSKYHHMDDFDDRAMESNFAQQQREEYISKKIGIEEDLEDMKQEALDKKRKLMMKKRKIRD